MPIDSRMRKLDREGRFLAVCAAVTVGGVLVLAAMMVAGLL